jgi:predicted DCC family thiol-disulfide oxidoreductase YuxK
MTNADETAPVLLYDGACGFCDRYVQLLLMHDRRRTMRFAALQSGYGKAFLNGPSLINVDTMALFEASADPG